MSIKLRDYINKNLNELELVDWFKIYDGEYEVIKIITWYKKISLSKNKLNGTRSNWKDDLFVEVVMLKIRGINNSKLKHLTAMTNLELVELLSSYPD